MDSAARLVNQEDKRHRIAFEVRAVWATTEQPIIKSNETGSASLRLFLRQLRPGYQRGRSEKLEHAIRLRHQRSPDFGRGSDHFAPLMTATPSEALPGGNYQSLAASCAQLLRRPWDKPLRQPQESLVAGSRNQNYLR